VLVALAIAVALLVGAAFTEALAVGVGAVAGFCSEGPHAAARSGRRAAASGGERIAPR